MGAPTGRATLEVVLVAVMFFLVQSLVVGIDVFALTLPLADRPLTLILSVYAHGSVGHLLSNLVGLVLFGLVVERHASRIRLHAFVLGTGIIAGVAEVIVGGLLGPPPLVLGLSGAVFALMGYVLGANRLTDAIAHDLDVRVQLLGFLVVAGALTWMTRGERVALVAHFTGAVLGLVAGRTHLLRA